MKMKDHFCPWFQLYSCQPKNKMMSTNTFLISSADYHCREFVSDFDAMMAKKKAENAKNRRKRKDFDLINDSDDLIAEMINKMKVAAEVL